MADTTSNTPDCVWCGEPLDAINDTDSETGGFWSAHWPCVHEHRDGRYIVRNNRSEETSSLTFAIDNAYGFSTLKRAMAQVEYLAGCNYPELWQFWVVDRETGEQVPDSYTPGKLTRRPLTTEGR